MTPKQLAVLRFLRDYLNKHTFGPTLVEIGKALGISKITALDHLRALQRRGMIRRERYCSRAVEILVDVDCPEPQGARVELLERCAAALAEWNRGKDPEKLQAACWLANELCPVEAQ